MVNGHEFNWLRVTRPALGVIFVVYICLVAHEAQIQAPTVDEVGHLPAGISHWQLGTFELFRANPPLVRMLAAVPVILLCDPVVDWRNLSESPSTRSELIVGTDFLKANRTDVIDLFVIARYGCLPLALVGAWCCYSWARDLYGVRAGMTSLLLWVFSPNILAHSQLITPDVGAAATGVALGYAFWRWTKRPSWLLAAFTGFALGVAELTKFTWIVLFPLLPLLWLGLRLAGRRQLAVRAEICQLILVEALAVIIVNAGYGFQGSFRRLGDYDFLSETLRGNTVGATGILGNRFRDSSLTTIPIPLPSDYVQGIDIVRHDFELRRPSYLRGEWQNGGWWYYYLYALLVKEPVGNWILLFTAVAMALCNRVANPISRRSDLVVVILAIAVVFMVSSQTWSSRHLRYVLPALPFAYVWMGQVGVFFSLPNRMRRPEVVSPGQQDDTGGRRVNYLPGRAALGTVLLFAFAWSIFSCIVHYPHTLSYFNEFAGGPMHGHEHLLNSNIDWGQDLLELKKWYDKHPAAKPFFLAYFGAVDPETIGIEFRLPPRGPISEKNTRRSRDAIMGTAKHGPGPTPGWFAVSVNLLRDTEYYVSDGQGGWDFAFSGSFSYFLKLRPAATAGYSIYIYHVTQQEANTLRADLGYPPLPD